MPPSTLHRLELKVIDLIAADLPDLLKQLNGRQVDGKTFKTAGAEVSEIRMSASERVFQKLWRPEVMFILMLIAIYGIIGEMTTPGAILPGRSRARAPRKDRQRRGRISSDGKNGAGGRDDEQGTDCTATAVPANHA